MQVIRVVKKFNSILSKHQRTRIIEIVIMMILGGIMETCSVSLIIPFMDVVMEPEKIMGNGFVRFVCETFGIESSKAFLVFLAVILSLVFLVKNLFLLVEYNIQYRFVYGNMFLMQERLLTNLINRPYEFFLGVDSGKIVRIVNSDTSNTFGLLATLLSLFTELVVSGMMVITVFIIAPAITMTMAIVLIVMVLIINSIIKPILRRAGDDNQRSLAEMNKWLLQSIQGIKELKVASKEGFFERKFSSHGIKYVNSMRKHELLSVVPRFLIEAIAMGTMFAVVAVLISRGAELETIVPILTAVAMAAMRLLPSINRVSSALGTISYMEPMLDSLINSLKDISGKERVSFGMDLSISSGSSAGSVLSFNNEIKLSGITYCYPGAEKNVLSNARLDMEKGQSIGIVGTSGAGKTTIVDVLLGLLNPKEGQVLVDGVDIKEDMPGFLSLVGYIPQSIFMLDDTIRANVAFGEENVSDETVWKALSEASLDEFVKELPDGLDTEIGERGVRLSGGQKQRIGIARALYCDPSILVFDEATSALDNETEGAIMDSINHLKGNKTMIIIAHRLTTIENCDVVYRVEDGMIKKER